MGANTGYSEEYKQNIFELHKKGKKAVELASEYGISKTTVNLWIRERSEVGILEDGTKITLIELKLLRNRIKEVEEENEILKKAITIFARK